MTTRQRKLGKRKGSQAFTLTELLVVLAIIAILMGLLIAFYSPSQEQRKVFECQNRLQVLHRALRLYMLDWDGFPASPYDSLDNDKDGLFDKDPPNGQDDDETGKWTKTAWMLKWVACWHLISICAANGRWFVHPITEPSGSCPTTTLPTKVAMWAPISFPLLSPSQVRCK